MYIKTLAEEQVARLYYSRCLGSTQHLKDRYGTGYVLEVKLGHPRGTDDDSHIKVFSDAVAEVFPGAELVESFGDRLTFKISQDEVRALSKVFAWFEEGKTFLAKLFQRSLKW